MAHNGKGYVCLLTSNTKENLERFTRWLPIQLPLFGTAGLGGGAQKK